MTRIVAVCAVNRLDAQLVEHAKMSQEREDRARQFAELVTTEGVWMTSDQARELGNAIINLEWRLRALESALTGEGAK